MAAALLLSCAASLRAQAADGGRGGLVPGDSVRVTYCPDRCASSIAAEGRLASRDAGVLRLAPGAAVRWRVVDDRGRYGLDTLAYVVLAVRPDALRVQGPAGPAETGYPTGWSETADGVVIPVDRVSRVTVWRGEHRNLYAGIGGGAGFAAGAALGIVVWLDPFFGGGQLAYYILGFGVPPGVVGALVGLFIAGEPWVDVTGEVAGAAVP